MGVYTGQFGFVPERQEVFPVESEVRPSALLGEPLDVAACIRRQLDPGELEEEATKYPNEEFSTPLLLAVSAERQRNLVVRLSRS